MLRPHLGRYWTRRTGAGRCRGAGALGGRAARPDAFPVRMAVERSRWA